MKSFTEMNVSEAALAVLRRHGIHDATPVQEEAIPVVRSGADAIVQAPTGTGKTLAFLLPLMERMKPHVDEAQVLIVTPTRELTMQIAKVARSLAEAFSALPAGAACAATAFVSGATGACASAAGAAKAPPRMRSAVAIRMLRFIRTIC